MLDISAVLVALFLLSVVAIALNAICIHIIRTSRGLWSKPSTLLVLNLLTVHLVQGLFLFPLYAFKKLHSVQDLFWKRFFANGFRVVYMLTFYGTVLGILFISIDRFLAAYLLNLYNLKVTKQRVKIALLALWAYIFVLCCIPFIPYDAPDFSQCKQVLVDVVNVTHSAKNFSVTNTTDLINSNSSNITNFFNLNSTNTTNLSTLSNMTNLINSNSSNITHLISTNSSNITDLINIAPTNYTLLNSTLLTTAPAMNKTISVNRTVCVAILRKPQKYFYVQQREWTIFMLITNTMFPYIMIVVLYVYIIWKLGKISIHQVNRRGSRVELLRKGQVIKMRHRELERYRQVSNLTLILAVSYAVFWTPSIVYYPLLLFCPSCFPHNYNDSPLEQHVGFIVKYMAFLDAVAAPLVYCFLHTEFRKSLKKISRRIRNRSHHQEVSTTMVEDNTQL